MPAREIWRSLADAAWRSGEPGVVFLGRYNALSTGAGIEDIISVNPCGEQGLGPYSVCNLGAMNLDAYVRVDRRTDYETKAHFDWDAFIPDVETAVTFLDNVIDKNFYFIPENEVAQKNLRRIGLGVMGLADALLALGLTYGSEGAVEFTDRVFSTMKTAAIRRSCVLAQQKGKAPAWDLKQTYQRPYFDSIAGTPLGTQVKKYGLRNMFLLTQAPTGTTSILAGVNSGIEPYFAFKYTRKDRTGTHEVLASAVEKYSAIGVKQPHWVTSNDVTVEGHIAMQAAAQRHIDSSVSKTINGPANHTLFDVEKAYTMAYDSGCKGLAYYRDGSRDQQVLSHEQDVKVGTYKDDFVDRLVDENEELRGMLDEAYSVMEYATEYKRPDILNGRTIKVPTRGGTAYVSANSDPSSGRTVEVFFNVGKAGSDVASMAEAMGRLASLALRKGATLGGVANQLEGVGGQSQFNKAIPHAIGEALTKLNDTDLPPAPKVTITMSNVEGTYEAEAASVKFTPAETKPVKKKKADLCPECGEATLVREEGCSKCHSCGYSAC
jgi:ribonucleoside-diphosphate reductase alpha chain